MMCLIASLPSFAACVKPPPEPIKTDDSVQCKQDCVTVSKGFVLQRMALEEQVIRLRAALRSCQGRP